MVNLLIILHNWLKIKKLKHIFMIMNKVRMFSYGLNQGTFKYQDVKRIKNHGKDWIPINT